MTPDDDDRQTTPAGHRIPVPSRDEVFRDLAKVARGKLREHREPEPAEDDDELPRGHYGPTEDYGED